MPGSSNSFYSGDQRQADALREVHARRAALQVLAVELRQLEVELLHAHAQIEGSQCYLRLMVPRQLLDQQLALVRNKETTAVVENAAGDAPDILLDVHTYVELNATKDALMRLVENNKRFGMVVDLMAAALHLMEPATDVLAQGFLRLHIQQCRDVIKQVHTALEDFPRMRLRLFKQFQGNERAH